MSGFVKKSYRGALRGVLVPSFVAGVLVALVVVAGASVFASSRPVGYEAEARLVVLPREGLDPQTVTAYYETLSQGQIVGTFSEVLKLDRFSLAAIDRLGLPVTDLDEIDVNSAVIPESAMISLTVGADDERVAEDLADRIVSESSAYLSELSDGYEIELVNSAAGTATPTGLSGLQYAAVMALAALVIGVAVQQVVQQVLQAVDRRGEIEMVNRRDDLGAEYDVPRIPVPERRG